jgi:hypothetical protein
MKSVCGKCGSEGETGWYASSGAMPYSGQTVVAWDQQRGIARVLKWDNGKWLTAKGKSIRPWRITHWFPVSGPAGYA